MAEGTFGYARSEDGTYIGYRIDGDGPIDIVHQPEWPGNIDLERDEPWSAAWLGELATIGRVIAHDHRGVGVSSRNVPLPNLETRVSDLLCVLDKVKAARPVLLGYLSSGAVHVLAAATRPDLARAIVWVEPVARYAWAQDYPWGRSWEELDAELSRLASWGTREYAQWFWESEMATGNEMPGSMLEAMIKQSRNACTPDVARELSRIWYDTDVRGVLQSVQTPTLLLAHEGRRHALEQARYIAELMPNAEVAVVPGAAWSIEGQRPFFDEIRRFIGVERPPAALDTILSTVLFTDIVNSTEKQASLGDRGWKGLVERHHSVVREALDRWHGVENDTAGDGFYATFDGPARAIHCAQEIAERVRDLGIEVRAGIHTGECEVIDGKCGGLTVSIGARVAAIAGPSEVLVSQTVKDLVAGSGFAFEDAGEHEMKGVPDRWHLYRGVGAPA
jgi:class 3 adenylate cyclase